MEEKLTIKYDGFCREMEDELRDLLKRHGWHWWASGHNMETGERDLAFERKASVRKDHLDGRAE